MVYFDYQSEYTICVIRIKEKRQIFMPYKEQIKNFNRIRDYIREFYIYGFKNRQEFTNKSARSYDNERRRLENILGEYMQSRQTDNKKNVFLAIDSRTTTHNPLYKVWKMKSFTDGDITLHFILMDILQSTNESMTLHEIIKQLDEYLKVFQQPRIFDESTIRKKLREYVKEGIIKIHKQGKTLYYTISDQMDCYDTDILDFFSEVAPCGVIGSFLLDKNEKHTSKFRLKHHYITEAIDSEILYQLFDAIHDQCEITIKMLQKRTGNITENKVIPLQVFISVQNGRQYLMAYGPRFKRILPFRIDHIVSVKRGKKNEQYEMFREKLTNMRQHIWGVSTTSRSGQRIETVEFFIHHEDHEAYIYQRLLREKRCGIVEKIDEHTSRFYAEVYDSSELIPWIRTFICRITKIHFSNKILEAQFLSDIRKMYELYGLEGGKNDIS